MARSKARVVPEIPSEHMRTFSFMFIWGRSYVKDHMPAGRAEKAMCLADIEMFLDWLNNNWPAPDYFPKAEK
jgi:hypothetical protein